MKLHELKPTEGARRDGFRLGRGPGSGNGKTSGKGAKGQKARSGGLGKPGFEGGQTPLARRLPKHGFSNEPHKKEYTIINLSQLASFKEGTIVTPELLKKQGIVKNVKPDGIKVLGEGELNVKLTVKANKFSQSAIAGIEKAGGSAEVI